MANHRSNSLGGHLEDWGQLRTIPAVIGMAAFLTTIFFYGAFGNEPLEFAWFDYQLTDTHAVGATLGIYAIAFASSETRDFSLYETWEQALIAAGPVLMAATWYSDRVHEYVFMTADPWLQIGASALVLAGYWTATQ